jgi:murein DD-endopeptidase MepM/ murein hydrolase activator NlpD
VPHQLYKIDDAGIMTPMLRWLAGLLVVAALVFGVLYVVAGRSAPPRLTIEKPDRAIGQTGSVEVTAEAPNARFTALTIAVEQQGKSYTIYALEKGGTPPADATPAAPNRVRIVQPISRQTLPQLVSGTARVVVTATRPSFLKLRQVTSVATKQFEIRLEPPRIAVLSTKHYVNHGGSEFVVYKVTPADVWSGVRVGDVEYPGFPISGAGVTSSDSTIRGAFFALLHDQPLNTPIVALARDEAGNQAKATFIDDVFEKPFKKSRIEIDDKFMNKTVPDIVEHSPELKMQPPAQDSPEMLQAFLRVNGELRKINAAEIAQFAAKSSPTKEWEGPFVQLGNSQVEASFADRRTYVYKGKEIDQQTHLGFDLAVTEHVPVAAANAGTVVNASWLGIYGNCVIVDHGMGVQSLYAHLMSFDVKPGDKVTRGQILGRSDSTGLAGGDHLHFTMLVGGRMVNPVEWWDGHWIADRVERKLKDVR